MLRKSSTRRSFHSYQSLEQRQLLASVTFDSGEVVVIGSAGDDVIRLIGSADFQSFRVSIDGSPELSETFQNTDVTKVSVFGGAGNDRVANTLMIDTLINGGTGNDTLQGGFGNDLLVGGAGADVLNSRNGDDTLNGGEGNDRLIGGNGADRLFGFGGNDTLFSGNGNDLLNGGDGNDYMVGNAGDDLLNGNDGNDRIYGSLGDDSVFGGLGDDIIYGTAGTNTLVGNEGNDRIFGGNGADTINGNSGDDFLAGAAGEDRIDGAEGVDTIYGGADDDILEGGDGNDFLNGQDGDDVLSGNIGADTMFGSNGDDLFLLTNGDVINGGAGVDEIVPLYVDQYDFRLDRDGSNIVLTDLRTPDTFGWIGTVTTTSIEQVNLFSVDTTLPIESLLWNPVVERVFVQPIVVSDDDGSNTAPAFGTAEQEAEIKRRVDRIYNQAGVDVWFLPTRQYNSTSANGVGTGERNINDFFGIISDGDAAGVGRSNPIVLDYYFTTRTPGQSTPTFSSGGLAYIGQSGAVQSNSQYAVDFDRARVALVLAHEIGHNFGLLHDESPIPSLLNVDNISNDLKAFQITQILDSEFSIPI